MRILVRFRNKEITFFEIDDETFTPPAGAERGFFQIGKDKASGQPVVVNLDDAIAFEPQGDDAGPWIG